MCVHVELCLILVCCVYFILFFVWYCECSFSVYSVSRKITESLQALSEASQKVSKLNEQIERGQQDREREMEVLIGKHEEDLKSFQERIEESVSTPNTVDISESLVFKERKPFC